uniref:Uncharacterized protein n=1 Tax=Avena sativa TaxID=4498 RepID=A0ACD6AIW2_AVESA
MADPDASRARETSPGDDASTSHAAPDSLQNTPSNIARLEDAIENCAARRKYLARTKSPSDGEDVRWYFCKVPLADRVLSASVPQTDIVGKGDYFRFSMRDCLALEASFLEREESLLGYWWREYAECSEGPAGSLVKTDMSDSEYLYKVEEERVGVPVKGGLYEVDLMRRHCFPVYWNGENRRVLRGHWFARKGGLDWIPLREDVSEQLELAYNCQVWHRRKFQPSGLFAARVDLQGSTPGLHAFFTGEDDTWEAWLVFDTGPKLGSNTIKIRRGFSSSGAANPTQVSSQLNQLYMKFLKRNPGYNGKVSLYGHSLGSVLTYDILCHQETLSAPFPTDYFNMEVPSDEGQVGKAPDTTAVHDSGVKEHDTSSRSGHSPAHNVNDVDEDSTRINGSLTDKIGPPRVFENVPNHDDTLASPIAVDGVQNEVVNQDENHQMTSTEEGDTSAVSAKDAESVSRSSVELHEEIFDKDKSISSLEEEVRRLKAKLAELERHSDFTESIRVLKKSENLFDESRG